jgi:hypothetical protein
MNTLRKIMIPFAMAGLLIAMLSGCSKPEGPAEKAGKAVDSATDKAGQKIEKAGESIQNQSNGKTP